MFTKLAARNVKRQMRNYLIYFMTVTVAVALLFALCNMVFSPQLQLDGESNSGVKNGLMGLIAFISIVVTFVIGYAASFMLKFRKQEFGMYLTLGMTRNHILLIFLIETAIMGTIALGSGVLLGLFFYQSMTAIMLKLMQMELVIASYSVKGLLITITLVVAIYLVSALAVVIYLKIVDLQELLRMDQKVKERKKHLQAWILITILSFLVLMGTALAFNQSTERLYIFGYGNEENMVLLQLLILSVALIVLHIGLGKSLIPLLLKNKTFSSRGTNTFTLRQLSGSININSVMIGLMAFLLMVSIVASNGAFCFKLMARAQHESSNPFDVTYVEETDPSIDTTRAILPEEAEPVIEKYAKIKAKCPYTTYTGKNDGGNSLYTGSFISESDFNALCKALNYQRVELKDQFLVVLCESSLIDMDYSSCVLEFGDQSYTFGGKREGQSPLLFHGMYTVVPDEAVKYLKADDRGIGYVLTQKRYDARALQRELTYTYTTTDGDEEYLDRHCDYWLKEIDRQVTDSGIAIFVIGGIYIAAAFLLTVMAILALKILSGLNEDRRRYQNLFRLGVGEQQQNQTLLCQTASFFFQPLLLPLLFSIPIGWWFGKLLMMHGCVEQIHEMHLTTIVIDLIIIALYTLYFTATYQIAKRSVVQRTRQ